MAIRKARADATLDRIRFRSGRRSHKAGPGYESSAFRAVLITE